MLLVRSFRRIRWFAPALLAVAWLLPTACATGATDESDEGGGVDDDGTSPHPDASHDDTTLPGLDAGQDSTLSDSGDGGSVKDATSEHMKKGGEGGSKDAGEDSMCTGKTVAVSEGGTAPTSCKTGGSCGDIASITGFSPTWVPPNPHASSCTSAQVTAIYADCFGPEGSESDCNSIKKKDATCAGCIFSDQSASSYGALVTQSNGGTIVAANQAGCIALLEPCNMACAEAFQDAQECAWAACEPNCPSVTTTAQANNYFSCSANSQACDPGGCDSYGNESTNCGTLLMGPGHAASVCIATSSSETFKQLYDSIVPVFCE